MKICIFSHTFPRFKGDSAAPFMGNLAEALASQKHKIFVLVPFDPKIDYKTLRPYKLIVFKYIFPNKFSILGYSRTFKSAKTIGLLTYLLSPLLYFFGFIALYRLVKTEQIDIINPHWLIPNGFITYFVKLLTGIPYVATIPGADIRLGRQSEIFKQMAGVACKGADHIISDSSHYIDQLNKLGFKPKNVSIIRYGVNTKIFKRVKKDTGLIKSLRLNSSDRIVLAVGRMVTQKGFIYLVRAFYYLAKKIPEAKLLLVGDGYEKAGLENEVKKLKIENSVIFTGTIPYDKLTYYYNIADVFVMPSIRDKEGNTDASPVAMMEAMSCGVSVVATRFAGSRDLVLEGKTGFLVKEKDSKQIAEAILKLLESKRNKSDIQSEVRKIALENFSLTSVSKKYIEIFKDCLRA